MSASGVCLSGCTAGDVLCSVPTDSTAVTQATPVALMGAGVVVGVAQTAVRAGETVTYWTAAEVVPTAVTGLSADSAAYTVTVSAAARPLNNPTPRGRDVIVGIADSHGSLRISPVSRIGMTGRNVIDVTQPPYNADPTGTHDATIALQAAIDTCSPGDSIYFPPGTYLVSKKLRIYDDTAHGNKRALRVFGSGGKSIGTVGSTSKIYWHGNEMTGVTAGIAAVDASIVTLALPGGALTAHDNEDEWIEIWGSAVEANNGRFLILQVRPYWMPGITYAAGTVVVPSTTNGFMYTATKDGISSSKEPTFPTAPGQTVPDDPTNPDGLEWTCSKETPVSTCKVFNPTPGAGIDPNNGNISWRVETCILDLRARECHFSHLIFAPHNRIGNRITALVNITESPNPGAPVVTQSKWVDCVFMTEQAGVPNGACYRWAVKIGQTIGARPLSIHNDTYSGGLPVAFNPVQLDYNNFWDCEFSGSFPQVDPSTKRRLPKQNAADEAAVSVQQISGQSRFNLMIESGVVGLPHMFEVAKGSAHCDFIRAGWGAMTDAAIQLGGSNSGVSIIAPGCESESPILRYPGTPGGSNQNVTIIGGYLNIADYDHPCRALIEHGAQGPISMQGLQIQGAPHKMWTIVGGRGSAADSNHEAFLSVVDCSFPPTMYQGRSASVTTRRKGPFAGLVGQKLSIQVTDAGVIYKVDLTFGSADFIDPGRARCAEVAFAIARALKSAGAPASAYGRADESEISIYGFNGGTSDFRQYYIQVTGGTARTNLGFELNHVSVAAATRSQVSLDTNGIVDSIAAGGESLSLSFENNCTYDNHVAFQESLRNLNKTYGSPRTGIIRESSLATVSGTSTTIHTSGGDVIFNGGETIRSVMFGIAEDDPNYAVQFSLQEVNGAPPVGEAYAPAAQRLTRGFSAQRTIAPGAGNSVTYRWQLVRDNPPPEFNPETSITSADLVGWYKTDALAAGLLSSWPNAATRASNLFGALAAGDAPTVLAAGPGGRPKVTFNGVKNYLTTPNLLATYDNPFYLFIAARLLPPVAKGNFVGLSKTATRIGVTSVSDSAVLLYGGGTEFGLGITPQLLTNPFVMGVGWDPNARFRTFGGEGNSAGKGNFVVINSTTYFGPPAGPNTVQALSLGASSTGSLPISVEIFEMMVYRGSLTNPDIAGIVTYLRTKLGISDIT
jgi:hypothetical protein